MKKTIIALAVMSLSVIANAQNSKKTINISELKPMGAVIVSPNKNTRVFLSCLGTIEGGCNQSELVAIYQTTDANKISKIKPIFTSQMIETANFENTVAVTDVIREATEMAGALPFAAIAFPLYLIESSFHNSYQSLSEVTMMVGTASGYVTQLVVGVPTALVVGKVMEKQIFRLQNKMLDPDLIGQEIESRLTDSFKFSNEIL